ncbi:protein-L-isoaspartate O-methyltransferase [Candidatus Dependentiae bacterium]|nr:protein-L-isoaspartate O-methyltransferase [Candidatus Dependentiae bacterium]
MSVTERSIEFLNNKMIREVQHKGYLERHRYLDAFKKVKRHLFVPSLFTLENGRWEEDEIDYADPQHETLKKIYVDKPLVVAIKEDEIHTTTSQPSLMAMMIDAGSIVTGMKILEIGTGSGYNAAILAEILQQQQNLVTMEIDRGIFRTAKDNLARAGYEKIVMVNKDGGFCEPTYAPYNSVIVTCACTDISRRWVDQLKTNGTLIAPLATRGFETLVRFKKISDKKLVGEPLAYVKFLRLQGVTSIINHYHMDSHKFKSFKRLLENEAKPDRELNELFAQNFHRKKLLDFMFYLSVVEKDTITYEDNSNDKLGTGYGIWNKEMNAGGLVLVFPGKVLHYGSEGVKNLIKKHIDDFHYLGNPKLSSYSIEIASAFKPIEKKDAFWNIKRRNFNTIYSLNK